MRWASIAAVLTVTLIGTGVGLAAGSLMGADERDPVTEEELLTELEGVNNSDDLEALTESYRAREDDQAVREVLKLLSELSSVETAELDVETELGARRIALESDAITRSVSQEVDTAACVTGLDEDEAPISMAMEPSSDRIIVDLSGDMPMESRDGESDASESEIGRLPVQNQVARCTV